MKAYFKESTLTNIITFCLFVFFILLYLTFPCKQYFFDGIIYSSIVDGTEPEYWRHFFTPNHFIYNYFGHLFYLISHVFGSDRDGYATLQLMNAFLGACGVSLFFLLVYRVTLNLFSSFAGALFLGFSFVYWWRSGDAMTYIFSVFFIVLSIASCIRYHRTRKFIDLLFVGVCSSMSILAHQSNVLFLPAVVFSILYSSSETLSLQVRARHLGILVLILLIDVAAPYIIVMVFARNITGVQEAIHWLLGLGAGISQDKYVNDYWSFSPYNILEDLRTIRNAIWYSGKVGYATVEKSLSVLNILSIVSQCIWGALFLYLVILRKIWKRQQFLYKLFIISIFSYACLFTWWCPGLIDYWIVCLIPLLFLFCLGLSDYFNSSSRHIVTVKSLTAFCLVLLVFANFFTAIYPQSKEENNIDLQIAYFIKKHVSSGAIVMAGVTDWHTGKVYIPQFVKVPRISFDLHIINSGKDAGLKKFEMEIYKNAVYNTSIYLLSGLLDSDKFYDVALRRWDIQKDDIDKIFQDYDRKFIASYEQKKISLYQLVPKEESPVSNIKAGYSLIQKKKYKEAIHDFEIGLASKYSSDVYITSSLLKCYLITGMPQKAISLMKFAQKLHPENATKWEWVIKEIQKRKMR